MWEGNQQTIQAAWDADVTEDHDIGGLPVEDAREYRRIRVCHLGKYYPPAPGGIEGHVQTLARAQAAFGADVHVVCINHLNPHGKDVTWTRYGWTQTVEGNDQGARVTRLGRSGCFARLDFVPQLPKLLRDLERGHADLLHLHTPNPTMVAILAALRPSIPMVVTHHSDVIKQRVLRLAYGPLERLVYSRAAMVFATSPAYAEGSPILRAHAEKVKLLPMGVDVKPFQNPSAAAKAHARSIRQLYGPNVWLCVGRCVYYKGFHTAIEALQHVEGKLIIIGSGPMEESLRKLAVKLGVVDRIVWWGRASGDELVGAYHAATALWFPSIFKSEAFGLVQVEAMACGCPVINTEIPESGVTWVSPHDETGLTVPINAPHALADAAARIAADPRLRQRLAARGIRRAVAEFDHHQMAIRTLTAYRQAIAVHRQFGYGRLADSKISEHIRRQPVVDEEAALAVHGEMVS